jgi:SAM-dependent methyltransferase
MEKDLNGTFWDNRYKSKETGWDIGNISTPLKDYIDQLNNKDISILIPGCGNAYEAAYLLEHGFTNITLVDISPLLVDAVKEKFSMYLNKQLNVVCADFFNLEGNFDLVLEQTFFCALDPSFRKKYVDKMHEILKPGGKIAGVLFNRDFEGGPPFGGSATEYQNLFSGKFEIKTMDVCYNSIAQRKGNEVFIIFSPTFINAQII